MSAGHTKDSGAPEAARERDGAWERRQRAGAAAEQTMGHYLHRELSTEQAHVIHGLRIVDPEQPESSGKPGVCQIDHLVVHRWGLVIVESKSVSEAVRIGDDGTGGDEWIRVWGDRKQGMPSPIQQARRQGLFLRTVLERDCTEVLGEKARRRSLIARILRGRGGDTGPFTDMPIQIAVAISDRGRIERINGWEAPTQPLPVIIAKADLVASKISEEIERHRAAARKLITTTDDAYGRWEVAQAPAGAIAAFLKKRHTPPGQSTAKAGPSPAQAGPDPVQPRETGEKPERRSEGTLTQTVSTDGRRTAPQRNAPQRGTPPDGKGTIPAHKAAGPTCRSPLPETFEEVLCKHCASIALSARQGRFGYYWRCGACSKNTSMQRPCRQCGAQGRDNVKIYTEGDRYVSECRGCGDRRVVWSQGRELHGRGTGRTEHDRGEAHTGGPERDRASG